MRVSSRLLQSFFRPRVVTEYQRQRVESDRMKWRAVHLFKWFISLGVFGYLTLYEGWQSSVNGRHANMWLREVAQDWFEEYVIGYRRRRDGEIWYGDPAKRPEGYALPQRPVAVPSDDSTSATDSRRPLA